LKILLTGREGQVGWELQRSLVALGDVVATNRHELDLCDSTAIRRTVREARPDIIVNAAAYTAVDNAESERDIAAQVNGIAPAILAEQAKVLGALLVHYSTDYVFDGSKQAPYKEEDTPNPLSVYGRTKLEGEQAIAASKCRHLIFRTSWVYASRGRNFLLAILKAAREKPELRVVDDQFGAPTSSAAIAEATARVLRAGGPEGLYHMSAIGRTTWFNFAQAILHKVAIDTPVVPIRSDQYPAKAKRPRNSVLDNARLKQAFGVSLPGWESQLEQVISQVLR
jgi:dTDP-4-dehydrorhamnose reductase